MKTPRSRGTFCLGRGDAPRRHPFKPMRGVGTGMSDATHSPSCGASAGPEAERIRRLGPEIWTLAACRLASAPRMPILAHQHGRDGKRYRSSNLRGYGHGKCLTVRSAKTLGLYAIWLARVSRDVGSARNFSTSSAVSLTRNV